MTTKNILLKLVTITLALTLLPACIAKQTLAEDILTTQDTVAVQAESPQTDENQQAQLEALSAQFETDDQTANELYRQALAVNEQGALEESEAVVVEVEESEAVVLEVEEVEEEVVEVEESEAVVLEVEEVEEEVVEVVEVEEVSPDESIEQVIIIFPGKIDKSLKTFDLTHAEH